MDGVDRELEEAGIEICFAEMKGPAKDRQKRYGLFAKLAGPPPAEVATSWSVFDALLESSPEAERFLAGAQAEAMALFPGPNLHLGGDARGAGRWP